MESILETNLTSFVLGGGRGCLFGTFGMNPPKKVAIP